MLFRTHTTGIETTDETVQWAVLRKTGAGIEKIREGKTEIKNPDDAEDESTGLFSSEQIKKLRSELRGILTISLPSSKLLMKVLELPSTEADELHSMVELQMDRISPFALDQLTISYELLQQTENHSRVLAVAAPRTTVDEMGEMFKAHHIHIRSLDSSILAWWSLLAFHPDTPNEGRAILFLEEENEFALLILDDGIPVCIRSMELFHDFSDPDVLNEISEEIRFTLLSLEPEYGARKIEVIDFWSHNGLPKALRPILQAESDGDVHDHSLTEIPSLAESLAQRSMERSVHHVELIPREWVELQRRKRFMRIIVLASIAVLAIWIAVIAISTAVFGIRSASFRRVEREAAEYTGPAREAQAARDELASLRRYADHTRSALECLREITVALPSGVELSSVSYTKGKAIRITGTGPSSDPIYTYFQKLGAVELFDGIKDPKVVRGTQFTIQALLPKTKMEETE